MREYTELKKKYPDAIIICRYGDEFITYDTDAIDTADILHLAVSKQDGVSRTSFPYHALPSFLPRLVRAGRRVAFAT